MTMTQNNLHAIPIPGPTYMPPGQSPAQVLHLSTPGVTVHNQSDQDPIPETFKITHDGRTTVIKPGESRLITSAALFHWFGDPHSGPDEYKLDDPFGGFRWVPKRSEELDRMRNMHHWDIGIDDSLLIVHPVPTFRIIDDQGNEVHTPCTDPEGTKVSVASSQAPDVNAQIELLQRQIAQQNHQVQLLMRQLGGVDAARLEDHMEGDGFPAFDPDPDLASPTPPPPDDNSAEPPSDDPDIGIPSPRARHRS